jgi:histidinol-phosphate aminotransferase
MKIDIDALIPERITELEPYASARKEFNGSAAVFLDANELPFGTYNRYPDPLQVDLKQQLARLKQVDPSSIFIGNGSDEIIDLCFRIFCDSGDKALCLEPTYGMYRVSAAINNIQMLSIPLGEDFDFVPGSFDSLCSDPRLRLIFLCSPNNPTGNTLNRSMVLDLLERFKGVVVIDEAYIDFAGEPSYISELQQNYNLIVLQTMSKAWGLAAIRLGMAFMHPALVKYFNNVKPPYNVSSVSQQIALETLQDTELYNRRMQQVLQQRHWLFEQLQRLPQVRKVYPSQTNFLLVEIHQAAKVYQRLVQRGIIVRDRSAAIPDCIRISVGTEKENELLLQTLINFSN